MVCSIILSRRSLKSLWITLSCILLGFNFSFAQLFPVQANINVAPPYSVYLSHYTSPGQEKVMVSVQLTNPTIPSIDVKFRFTIEGAGIRLTTSPAWTPPPFTLSGGVLVSLPQEIIAEYLKPQHLLTEGVNPVEFYRSGKLPEGFYQFKVEVVEYRRNIVISNIGRAMLWLVLNEPPRIVFPLPEQKVMATNPQMLNFTWIPSGASSPLSSLTTQYEFTLIELVDKGIDPTVAITTASNASKYVKVTDQTNLFYGPGEMPLTPGKTYAIRVKAFTSDGLDMFKNGGYSEVRTFKFGDACNAPLSFTLKNPKQSQFDISVITDPSNTAWQVRFRETSAGADLQSVPSNPDGGWSELKSEPGTQTKTPKGLKASTKYEVQVKGLCGEIASDYNPLQTITTSPLADANRSCDGNPTPFAADNAPALTKLSVNDLFLAALFPIKVTEVKSQAGGRFTGSGVATLPLFNVGLAVTFDNIGINNLMQLTSGEVKVVRNEVTMALIGETQNPPVVTGGNDPTDDPSNPNDYPPITDTLKIPIEKYDSLKVTDNGTIIFYPPNGGAPVTVDLGGSSTTLLVPADGNMDNAKIVYDGAAHPYTPNQGGSGGNGMNGVSGFLANFRPSEQQVYGFDSMQYAPYTGFYNEMRINGKLVKLPWKALEMGKPDPVNLSIKRSNANYPYTNLKVGVMGGADLLPSAGGDTPKRTYNLVGATEGEEAIVATFQDSSKTKYAGGIWTATYKNEPFKLYLVPMSGIDITEAEKIALQGELNTMVFNQAVVTWTVSILPGITGVELGDNGLDWADKDMLSSYNTEMNGVISTFKTWKPNAETDAYYLFVVPKFSEGGVEGFMPRNRRFGFITREQVAMRTVAHELGHGAFNLKHTFPEVPQGTTKNLMDYSDGLALYKPQWDLIHNPEFTTGLWDGMEDGASIDASKLVALETGAGINMNKSITCLSIAGVPITLPDELKSVEFIINNPYVPEGALVNFKAMVNGSEFTYVGIYNTETKEFMGYSKVVNPNESDIEKKCETVDGQIKYYKETKTKSLLNDASSLVCIGFRLCCAVDVRTVPIAKFPANIIGEPNQGRGKPADKIRESYFEGSTSIHTENDPKLCPPELIKVTPLTFKDVFTGYEWSHYNVYGDGGVLIKLKIDDWDEYYYTNQYANGNYYCYRYVYRYRLDDGYWIKSEIPQPKPGDSYSDAILSSQFALKFIKEIAPTVLDAASNIPVYGIPFGVANGIWYWGKGEKGNAFLSFATCVPLGFVVNAGVKWSHVIVQTGSTYRIVKVSEETSTILKTFVTDAEAISKTVIDDGVKEITLLVDRFPDYINSVKALVDGSKDKGKLIELLKRLSSLGDDAVTLDLIKDITIKTDDVNHIANNLDKIDDDIIEAWKLLDGSAGIRKGFDNLDNLKKVLKSEVYKNWGTLEELKAAINKSTSKAQLIEDLSIASPLAKYPENGFRELAESWTGIKQQRYKDALDYYKQTDPTKTVDKIHDELRGIDFDDEVAIVQKKEGDEMFMCCYLNEDDTGYKYGGYCIENKDADIGKLGLPLENRYFIKIRLKENMSLLKSKTVNIKDWTLGQNRFLKGGEDQLFNPTLIFKVEFVNGSELKIDATKWDFINH